MKNKVLLECVKSFSVGAIIGLAIVYFRKSDSLITIFISGFIVMSIHIRNNSSRIGNNK
jgi:hypothetical protein